MYTGCFSSAYLYDPNFGPIDQICCPIDPEEWD